MCASAVRASPPRYSPSSGRLCNWEEVSENQRLKGRRIAALAADGFEKVELVVPKKALQAAGAQLDVISLRHGNIRDVNR